jgi:diketogulonate reductase-like aldo/keto reductase
LRSTIETDSWGWTGVQVPKLGQGTWKMEADDAAQATAALRAGLDAGLTHVDTAELYGNGRVEELVGRALAGRREEVFLVSKVQPSNASRQGTLRACERSLRRLQTDRLDCYLLHWPGPHPLEDTIAAFEELVQAGKVRCWGLSNFDVADLEGARRIAGPRRIACNQVLYHLEARDIEAEVLPWCLRHEVAVAGYSPFGSGRFPAPSSKGGKVLARVAAVHRASAFQVALAFLVRQSGVLAIPKAADPEHVRSNAAAAALHLSPAEVDALEAAFPAQTGRGLPML